MTMGEKTFGKAAAGFLGDQGQGRVEEMSAADRAELEQEGGGDGGERREGAADVLKRHREAVRDDGPGSDRDDLDDENPTEADEDPALPQPRGPGAYPEWATLPAVFNPPRGARVAFVRFPSDWTHRPDMGEVHSDEKGNNRRFRWCVMWSLTPGDEIIAAERCRGNGLRTIEEFTKQSIRIVDGFKSDWSGKPSPGSVNLFWKEIGASCRKELKNAYLQTHMLSREQRIDFFVNCIVVATSAG